jgi:hypothetical protein
LKRPGAMAGSLLFLDLIPGSVAVVVPWWICGWTFLPPLMGFAPLRCAGALAIAAGLPILLDSFVRFAV